MSFGLLLFPVDESSSLILFGTQLKSAIARFENQLTPLRFRGRKRKYDRHQVSIYRGDTETFIIQVTLNDENFDLTALASTLQAQIREKPDAADSIYSATITDGVNGNIFAEGHIVWVIPAATTSILPMKCHFDIQAIQGENINTICSGIFERVDDITR